MYPHRLWLNTLDFEVCHKNASIDLILLKTTPHRDGHSWIPAGLLYLRRGKARYCLVCRWYQEVYRMPWPEAPACLIPESNSKEKNMKLPGNMLPEEKEEFRRMTFGWKQTESFKKGDRIQAALSFWSGCPPQSGSTKKIKFGEFGVVSDNPKKVWDPVIHEDILMIPIRWDNGIEGEAKDTLIRKAKL